MAKKISTEHSKAPTASAEIPEEVCQFISKSLLRSICNMVETYDFLLLLDFLAERELANQRGLDLPTTVGNGRWEHEVDLTKAKDALRDLLAEQAAKLTEAVLQADPARLVAYILDTAWNSHECTRKGRKDLCKDLLEEAGYTRSLSEDSFIYGYDKDGIRFNYGHPDYESFTKLVESL